MTLIRNTNHYYGPVTKIEPKKATYKRVEKTEENYYNNKERNTKKY